jgi:seryl-tRNA synthetase
MLARELLRNHPEEVRDRLATRGVEPELFNTWEELDTERRESLVKMEELKRQRNEASKAIGKIKQEGGDATAQIEEVGRLKGRIAEIEERVNDVTADLSDLELRIPNLPHESVPIGTDEEANRIERVVGEIPSFDFEPQAHWDLGPELGILDFERGAKVTGARFTTYFGAGAHLERALINFFLDLHTREHGYTEVLPPFVVSGVWLVGSGQLPMFADVLFKLVDHE